MNALFARGTQLTMVLALATAPALAQEVDHSKMHHPPPTTEEKSGEPKPVEAKPVVAVDHAAMGHATPEVDHAAMGHATPEVDHAAMGHTMPAAPTEPKEPIPAVTDADRLAAFPKLEPHHEHGNSINSYWLMDHLEAWDADEGTGLGWEATAWIGTDLDRVWLRSEGEAMDGSIEAADIEVLYGRSVSRWWDVVAGIRHDFGEGPSQTFAAIGLMGLAPYKFEVQATAYIGQSGQTAAQVEVEYDTLFTNRWIGQWKLEANFHGKQDELRGIGAGLGTMEAGFRLRYEITRQFAPYVGVVREWAFGGTADLRREHLEVVSDTRVVVGLRFWF